MELEDLMLKVYRVEKIDGRMVATLDPEGNYKACSPREVEKALTTGITDDMIVDVKIGNRWLPMKPG